MLEESARRRLAETDEVIGSVSSRTRQTYLVGLTFVTQTRRARRETHLLKAE